MPLLRCIARRLACRNEASGSKQARRYSQGRCSAVKGVMRDIARPSGLQLVELPEPGRPAPGEVLVRMAMAPVNPADRLTIAGRYQPLDEVPELLGAEGAGIVEACGRGVRGVEAGDQVLLMTRGNWVGRRRVPADDVVRVPASLAVEQAAMLRINPATAWRLLDRARVSPGEWLAQNAATSSAARWVRRLAERRQVRVVNVSRAAAEGASGGWLADGADLAERVTAATAGAPVRAALDAVAGTATGRLAACLGPGGQILVYGHLSGEPCSIPSALLTTRGLQVSGFSLRPAEAGEPLERRAALYAELAELAAQAAEPVAAIFPLDEAEAAVATAAAGGRKGRVLLRLDG